MKLVNFSVERYFLVAQLGNFCLMKTEREREGQNISKCIM